MAMMMAANAEDKAPTRKVAAGRRAYHSQPACADEVGKPDIHVRLTSIRLHEEEAGAASGALFVSGQSGELVDLANLRSRSNVDLVHQPAVGGPFAVVQLNLGVMTLLPRLRLPSLRSAAAVRGYVSGGRTKQRTPFPGCQQRIALPVGLSTRCRMRSNGTGIHCGCGTTRPNCSGVSNAS